MISPVFATWPARLASESGTGAACRGGCGPRRAGVPRWDGRARLGPREAPRVVEDALEQGVEVPLARQSDPDLEQLLEQVRSVHRGREARGGALRVRHSLLAAYSARSAAAIRSSALVPSSGRQAT